MLGLDCMNYCKTYRNTVGFILFKSGTNLDILVMLVQDKRGKTIDIKQSKDDWVVQSSLLYKKTVTEVGINNHQYIIFN